jgi:hypothetical protein
MPDISNRSGSAIEEIYGRPKALIGMIHCPPFPGAPRYRGESIDQIYDACLRDAEALISGGLHGLIVENHGDIPFSKPEDIGPETPAFLAVVTDRVRRATGVPVGINVLANAPLPALAAAVAGGAISSGSTNGPMPMLQTRASWRGVQAKRCATAASCGQKTCASLPTPM